MKYADHNFTPTNFLKNKPESKNRAKNFSKKIIITFILFAVAALAGLSVKDLLLLKKIYHQTLTAKSLVVQAKDYFIKTDFDKASQSLSDANKIFEQDIDLLDHLIVLDKTPVIKNQIVLWRKILLVGHQTGGAMQIVIPLARETLELTNTADSFENLFQEKGRAWLQQVVEFQPQLQSAREKINLSKILLDEINQTKSFKELENIIQIYSQELEADYQIFQNILTGLQIAPEFLGYDETKTYLLIFQNNTELRPTGGFIGSYGLLKIKNAYIQDLKIFDVYNLDKLTEGEMEIPSPEPLCQYAHWCDWYLRDANWSPDFPTSAQKIIYFYEKESEIAGQSSEKIDGVITVNPAFVSGLLNLIGPVALEDLIFTNNNFVDLLQQEVQIEYYKKGVSKEERKDILNDLYQRILNNVLTLSLDNYQDFFALIGNNLKHKDVLFYSNNPEIQQFLNEQNWDGKIRSASSDYLMLVDANLNSRKTDRLIERQINYKIKQTGEKLIAELTINYENQALEEDWRTTNYRTYTRIYAPKGAKLIDSTGFILDEKTQQPAQAQTYQEFDKTVFAGFLAIPLQQKRSVWLKYELPLDIKNDYFLLVQKQPGTGGHPFNAVLDFDQNIKSLNITDINADSRLLEGQQAKFNIDLSVDRAIEVKF